ncbi:MAG: Glu-tRNA(Gln) amidotransferase subunit GatE [Thermoprotei archaeon]
MKVGLEIHQQLDTREKLFCSCPTTPAPAKPDYEFRRVLHATKSELGAVDPAARFEEVRNRVYVYQGFRGHTCLVEMDEEPPHELNREALEVALMCAILVGARPVDEVVVMRKIVIDGSNTSGFQRTALVAFGGEVKLGGKTIGLSTICLEEDAARLVSSDTNTNTVTYRLDRLGVPLIEISTKPDITSPEEAGAVAYEIGRMLRRLRKVKRGLGTIRQDINVSVEGGARIEVKGVQELSLIPKVVGFEVRRQEGLLKLREELRRRVSNVKVSEAVDLTSIFAGTNSKTVRQGLEGGGVVLGVRVDGFSGFFRFEVAPGRRFGAELADYARQIAGVGGLFHSDELPAYGITQGEVDNVRRRLGCAELDGFILVVAEKSRAERALGVVAERCARATDGVVEETRAAQPDGTTRFLRPMPGSARMYPETDVPNIRVSRELINRLKSNIPPPLEELEARLVSLGVGRELAGQAVESEWLNVLEALVSESPGSAQLACSVLTQDVRELSREGVGVDGLTDEVVLELLRGALRRGLLREQVKQALRLVATNSKSVGEALDEVSSATMSIGELDAIIQSVIDSNRELVRSRGAEALKPLMGDVMKVVRGRVPGSVVSQRLAQKLRENVEKPSVQG